MCEKHKFKSKDTKLRVELNRSWIDLLHDKHTIRYWSKLTKFPLQQLQQLHSAEAESSAVGAWIPVGKSFGFCADLFVLSKWLKMTYMTQATSAIKSSTQARGD